MGTCRKFARLILLAMCASVGASHASATVPPQAQTRPLRAATARKAPFVLEQGDQLTGFSIDLWDTLARRLHADFSWVELKSSSELLQAVQRGDADVAIGAITMTPEREQVVDFSHPYFDSGLQIMARAQSDSSLLNTIQRHLSPAIGQFLGAAIITMFLLANVLWLVERRNNLHFQRGYVLCRGLPPPPRLASASGPASPAACFTAGAAFHQALLERLRRQVPCGHVQRRQGERSQREKEHRHSFDCHSHLDGS